MNKFLLLFLFQSSFLFAQLPNPCLVGYWQNWSPMKLSEIHDNYNVIELAFATTKNGTDYDMEFNLPSGYTKSAFLTDIDALHTAGKVVILSIGGASDPVILDSEAHKNTFISTVNQILADYNYKIDGIDLDLESTSLNFGAWTMDSPAQGQLNIIEAVNQIKTNYFTQTGKRLLLTMAPETVYLQGGLSDWQINNINGGAYLPIVNALIDDLDLLCPQYYNAGGAGGGTFANDGQIYYDTGDPDYLTALTETLVKGFTIKAGKGFFPGVPVSKLAIGLPANDCNAAGTGYVTPENVCNAVKYLRGDIAKPNGFDYSLNNTYPNFRGLMTWSINEDALACSGAWSFAENFTCAFENITSVSSPEFYQIEFYPNIIQQGESLHLELSNYKTPTNITVINTQGETMYSTSISSPLYSIATEKLPRGIYLLKIADEKPQKFIIQ